MVCGSRLRPLDGETRAREKTLRAAVLLSVWAPFATFVALLLGRSTTQAADFVRRTVEFGAVLGSWLAFRRVQRVSDAERRQIERSVRVVVGVALLLSALAILVLAVVKWLKPTPTGNVVLGFVIAALGAGVNAWFWARYERFERQERSPIVTAQARLYRAKTFVDVAVLVALGSLWIFGDNTVGHVIDLAGSVVVALYLAWSSYGQLTHADATPVLRDHGASE